MCVFSDFLFLSVCKSLSVPRSRSLSLSVFLALLAYIRLQNQRNNETTKQQAPPEKFGETLEAEQLRAGSFIEDSDVDPDQWERMMEIEVGNGENKLFGGAQYHRALREFNFAIRHMNAPEVCVALPVCEGGCCLSFVVVVLYSSTFVDGISWADGKILTRNTAVYMKFRSAFFFYNDSKC